MSRILRALGAPVAALALLAAPVAAQERQETYHRNEEGERAIGYAQAVRVGNTVYVSGTVGGGATLEAQLADAYRGITETLARFGATPADIVRETIYTTDMEALQRAIPLRKQTYGERYPAATWVQVSRLFTPEILVEVEVTAVIGSAPAR